MTAFVTVLTIIGLDVKMLSIKVLITSNNGFTVVFRCYLRKTEITSKKDYLLKFELLLE